MILKKNIDPENSTDMEEFKINGKTVRECLLELQANGNKAFCESLNPGVENILGLRLPDLRKLAQAISKSNWQLYLNTASDYYMEERMLQGLVLGYIKPDDDIEVYLGRVTRFVRIINSWSVCDVFKFAGGKKYFSVHSDRFWSYLLDFMNSDKEYEIRFGVVMSLKYFIDESHVQKLLSVFDGISHDGYYVKMAVAWAISYCFIDFPEITLKYLESSSLDRFTYNKAIQKSIESYRVTEDYKKILKSIRRK